VLSSARWEDRWSAQDAVREFDHRRRGAHLHAARQRRYRARCAAPAGAIEEAQWKPDVVLIVELRSNPHGETLHREQVRGLSHHNFAMIEFQKRRKVTASAHKALHAIVSQSGFTPALTATRAVASRSFAGGNALLRTYAAYPCPLGWLRFELHIFSYARQFGLSIVMPEIVVSFRSNRGIMSTNARS